MFGNQQSDRLSKYWYIFFLFSCVLIIQAQKSIQVKPSKPSNKNLVTKADTTIKTIKIVNADVARYDKNYSDANFLIGNVKLEHDGAFLNCDTALLYEKENKLEAFGHVLISKGDSITVTGQKLYYDGKTKIATLTGSVVCTEKDMVLTTNLLTFDVGNSIANYYDGGTIVNKDNTLKSKNGHYYSQSKELAFHYDVELVNPDYTMNSDTLLYNTVSKTAYFLGPSIITSKTDYIYCRNGWYNTEKDQAQFSKDALLVTKDQKLKGDSLFYDRNKKFGKAFKNVMLVDTGQKSILFGDYVEYQQKDSRALVTKKAMFAKIVNGDTLFLAADTIQHFNVDSVHNFLKAYHHVKMYKRDIQAQADSAIGSTKDSLIQLFKSPVFWSHHSQATARTIKVFLRDSTIKSIRFEGNAFLIQLVDSLDSVPKFNQLLGKRIDAFFENDTIRKATINGNAQILYFVTNKNKPIGLNKTTCENINLWFRQSEIIRVTTSSSTDGDILPLKEVDITNARLKGFSWLYKNRPRSRFELHAKETTNTNLLEVKPEIKKAEGIPIKKNKKKSIKKKK
jgi:lipopolysaccharide export system protein LptA